MSSGARVVTRTVTDEVDGYTSSVAGVELQSVRGGRGTGPSKVTAALSERFAFTSSKIGFPMLTSATIADDVVALALIGSSPPGNRWCETDLSPGAVVLYGPQAEHTALNRPGLEFTFTVVACRRLFEHAEELGLCIAPPDNGEMHLVARTPRTDLLRHTFPLFALVAESGVNATEPLCDSVMRAMVYALSERDRPRRIGVAHRIDSRQITHVCIDYASSIKRIPSISELCLVAHVSERRLRKAFVDEFDRPPSRFFRAWALNAAHRRLVASQDGRDNVTRVASDLGFPHLGRFSGDYRAVYGEAPSSTLRRRGVRT
jgi:AraC-like DNA-binding protein